MTQTCERSPGTESALFPGRWVVLVYHAFLAVFSLLYFVGSLFVLALNPPDATTVTPPPLALFSSLFLGWLLWGIGRHHSLAIRWARRFHAMIVLVAVIVGVGGFWYVVQLMASSRGDRMIGVAIILLGVVAPSLLVAAPSWGCWWLLRPADKSHLS